MPSNKTQDQNNTNNKYNNMYHHTSKEVLSHVNVDISSKQADFVGGNNSSRMPIAYVDESGKMVRGFFTQNEFINKKQIFSSRISKFSANPKYEKYQPVMDCFLRSIDNIGMLEAAYAWSRRLGISDGYFNNNFQSLDILKKDSGSSANKRINLINMLISNGVSEDLLNKEKNNKDLWDYISGLLSTAATAHLSEKTHIKNHYQASDTNVNKRNNAMYDIAKILGFERLICRSSSMTVIQGNAKYEGSFMLDAVGVDRLYLDPRNPKINDRPIEFSASALRDISNLQILDFLCGNVDRHGGNMFYQLDYSDPQKVKIVGVQGIDNDASFGTVEAKKRTSGYFSSISDIHYIDAEMAKNIMNLNTENIEQTLRITGLSANEVQATYDRLLLLKENIKNGKIQQISGIDKWEEFTPEMNGQTKDFKVRYANELTKTYNIFDNAADELRLYKHRRKALHNGQKLNDLPKTPKYVSGITKSSFEHNTVDVHKNALQNLNKQIHTPYLDPQTKKRIPIPKEIQAFSEKLDNTIKYMEALSNAQKKEYNKLTETEKELYVFTLSDKNRNRLVETLDSLKKEASAYVGKPVQDRTAGAYDNELIHYTKNVSAYLDFARESIQKDALEAEKLLASQMNEKLAEEIRVRQSLPELRKTVDKVDSAFIMSSKEFKIMVSNLNTLDPTKLNTVEQKEIVYNRLIDLANKYIDHKLPQGKKESDLNDYEKARVNFARDIIGYGITSKLEARQQENARKENKVEVKKNKENVL